MEELLFIIETLFPFEIAKICYLQMERNNLERSEKLELSNIKSGSVSQLSPSEWHCLERFILKRLKKIKVQDWISAEPSPPAWMRGFILAPTALWT